MFQIILNYLWTRQIFEKIPVVNFFKVPESGMFYTMGWKMASHRRILSTVPSALCLMSIFYVGYQLHTYILSYMTKTQNRIINGMLHRISKFHRKASFINVTLFTSVNTDIPLRTAFLFTQDESVLACRNDTDIILCA